VKSAEKLIGDGIPHIKNNDVNPFANGTAKADLTETKESDMQFKLKRGTICGVLLEVAM